MPPLSLCLFPPIALLLQRWVLPWSESRGPVVQITRSKVSQWRANQRTVILEIISRFFYLQILRRQRDHYRQSVDRTNFLEEKYFFFPVKAFWTSLQRHHIPSVVILEERRRLKHYSISPTWSEGSWLYHRPSLSGEIIRESPWMKLC